MHFFEITDPKFLLELTDYLPREVYDKSQYLLFTSKVSGRTFLVTEITLLQQVMDGFALRGHCKHITKKKMKLLNTSHEPSQINIIAGTDLLAKMKA